MKEIFNDLTVRVFELDPLRFEAGPSIGRTEGPARSLLIADVDRNVYVRQDPRFALSSPEVAPLDQVG